MNTTKYAPVVQCGLYCVIRASWEGVGWSANKRWAGIKIPSGRVKDLGVEEASEWVLPHQFFFVLEVWTYVGIDEIAA